MFFCVVKTNLYFIVKKNSAEDIDIYYLLLSLRHEKYVSQYEGMPMARIISLVVFFLHFTLFIYIFSDCRLYFP